MSLRALAAVFLAVLIPAASAEGHPAPFSYLDLHVSPGQVDVSLIAHVFDVAHDLPVDEQARLLEAAFLGEKSLAIAALLGPRLHIAADGAALEPLSWSTAEPLAVRQAIRLRSSARVTAPFGVIRLDARMFPYDPAHQTFVNVYENGALALQAILGAAKPTLDFYAGSREGALAVARRFAPVGFQHVLFGPDHLVFIVGLLLLGASARQGGGFLAAVAGGNLIAWLLTWLNVAHPPARVIEPTLALGLVYLGADNLLVRGGRDVRVMIAFAFGLMHGFWFAIGLREMDLPASTLGWSLLAFGAGVEGANAIVLSVVGVALSYLRRARSGAVGRGVAVGSVAVAVAGAYWFVERVFFPAGLL